MVQELLAKLDSDHRIGAVEERALQRWLHTWQAANQTQLVPTHGDYQPRNWLICDHRVTVIDFGRFNWRTPEEDLTRLAAQEFIGYPDREEAFIAGYGADLRQSRTWPLVQIQAAVGTAVWAYHVGDGPFEQQGHAMIAAALAEHQH